MNRWIETYGTGNRIRALSTYMIMTSLAGCALIFQVLRSGRLPDPLTTVLYVTLGVVGYHFSVRFPDGNTMALADPIVYAALWAFGTPLAVLTQVAAVVAQFFTTKKALLNTFFNSAQFTVCIIAANVWSALASSPAFHAPLAQIFLVLLMILTFDLVNYIFVGAAVAMDQEHPWKEVFIRLSYSQRKKTLVLSYLINMAGVLLASYMGLAGIVFVFAGVFVMWLQLKFEQELARKSIEAQTDPLTGLYNVRYLEDWLEGEFTKLDPEKDKCSVVFIDVDGLKGINDGLGHDAGDAALVHLGKVLKAAVRADDKVIRYGGDEFILICRNADLAKAQGIAERILAALEKSPLEHDERPVPFSVSAGIASFPTHSVLGRDLVRLADKSMYLAKKDGGRSFYTADSL